MRPVNKGKAPQTYTKYQQALNDLRGRIGGYCSYCERRLVTTPAVEHVVPKNPKTGDPSKELDWDNFLLACTNCNSTKGNKPVTLNDYVWPDLDNTAAAFVYGRGTITVSPNLSTTNQERAQALLNLVGLDKVPNAQEKSARLDLPSYVGEEVTKGLGTSHDRWLSLHSAYADAEDALNDLINAVPNGRKQVIKSTLKTVEAQGHWSVYRQVFANEPEFIEQLLEHPAFPGTAKECFEGKEKGFAVKQSVSRPKKA